MILHRRRFSVRNKQNVVVLLENVANRDSRSRQQTVLYSLIRVIKQEVKVKFTLEQATKVQRRSRGIALLFL